MLPALPRSVGFGPVCSPPRLPLTQAAPARDAAAEAEFLRQVAAVATTNLVSDDLWEALQPLLPSERWPGSCLHRAALGGILYILRHGLRWRRRCASWREAVHVPGIYDLEVDTSVLQLEPVPRATPVLSTDNRFRLAARTWMPPRLALGIIELR